MLFTPYHIVRTRIREEIRGEVFESIDVQIRPLVDAQGEQLPPINAEDAPSALETLRQRFPQFPPGFLAVRQAYA